MAKRNPVSDGSYTANGFVQGHHNDSEWAKSTSGGCAGVAATIATLGLAVFIAWTIIALL